MDQKVNTMYMMVVECTVVLCVNTGDIRLLFLRETKGPHERKKGKYGLAKRSMRSSGSLVCFWSRSASKSFHKLDVRHFSRSGVILESSSLSVMIAHYAHVPGARRASSLHRSEIWRPAARL